MKIRYAIQKIEFGRSNDYNLFYPLYWNNISYAFEPMNIYCLLASHGEAIGCLPEATKQSHCSIQEIYIED